jgi:hypothetical protein
LKTTDGIHEAYLSGGRSKGGGRSGKGEESEGLHDDADADTGVVVRKQFEMCLG